MLSIFTEMHIVIHPVSDLSVQMCVREVSRGVVKELVTQTHRLLSLCDTVPTLNEIVPGSKSPLSMK